MDLDVSSSVSGRFSRPRVDLGGCSGGWFSCFWSFWLSRTGCAWWAWLWSWSWVCFFSAAVSTTTSASTHAAASPTCASYLPPPAGLYHHILSFSGRPEQQQYLHGGDIFGAFQYYGAGAGGHAVLPVVVPQKSSPTTECSSSISSMSSSPTATAVSAPKPQPTKRKGSRGSDQRRAAPAAAASNKRPKGEEGAAGREDPGAAAAGFSVRQGYFSGLELMQLPMAG